MSEVWVDRPPADWDRFYRQMEDLDAAREFDRDRSDREFEMAGAPSWLMKVQEG